MQKTSLEVAYCCTVVFYFGQWYSLITSNCVFLWFILYKPTQIWNSVWQGSLTHLTQWEERTVLSYVCAEIQIRHLLDVHSLLWILFWGFFDDLCSSFLSFPLTPKTLTAGGCPPKPGNVGSLSLVKESSSSLPSPTPCSKQTVWSLVFSLILFEL